MARMLGAVCTKGFTEPVTHLVSNGFGGKKYHVSGCN